MESEEERLKRTVSKLLSELRKQDGEINAMAWAFHAVCGEIFFENKTYKKILDMLEIGREQCISNSRSDDFLSGYEKATARIKSKIGFPPIGYK